MSASTEKKLRQAAREAGTDKKTLAAQEEAKKQAQSKRRWTLSTILVVLLIAAIIFLNSGFLYKHADAVTVNGEGYSPAEVSYQYASQYYYWLNQYGSYASIFGLDSSMGLSGLDSQACSMTDGGTWRDYFIDAAITQIIQSKALNNYAAENGITLDEDEKAIVDDDLASLESYAKLQGFSGVSNFLAANYGKGVTVELARQLGYESSLASKAADVYSDSLEYSAAELSEQYASYNGDRDYFDYAYYLVSAEKVADADGNEAATDETISAARNTADAILAAFEALSEETDTELRLNEAIAEVAAEGNCTLSSAVTGSSLGVYKDWLMDSARVSGDAAVVENSNGDGFYVVSFINRNDNNYKLAQVRHILIKAEADENGDYTDEAKAAAKARAEELLAEWQSGDATEESFAVLADANSEDSGSNTNGGLYDSVRKGQMVEEFDAFCFGEHKHGDTAIVYGESGSYAGYHVMYYVGEGQLCSAAIAEDDLKTADLQSWLDELTAPYTAVRGFWLKLVG